MRMVSEFLRRRKAQVGEAIEDGVERDAAFDAGERGADAEMDAKSERHMVVRIGAMHIEAIGIGEACVVAIG